MNDTASPSRRASNPPGAGSVEAAVLDRVRDAPPGNSPFEHCIVDDVFPAGFLHEIYRHWPTEDELMPIEDSGRVTVAPGQRGKRRVVFLSEQGLERLAPERRAFWRDAIWRWLSGPRFRQVLLDKFPAILAPRITPGTQVVADGLLVSDRTGYAIGPHTDSPRRLVSLLFYLPRDGSLSEFGTSFYAPRQPGFTSAGGPHLSFGDFTRLQTVAFIPNRLVIFPKTDRCFHGVEPLTPPGADRRLLIFDLQLAGPLAAPQENAASTAEADSAVTALAAGSQYGRSNPSPRYAELVRLYRQMHDEGERFKNIPPEHTFAGQSLAPHLRAIRELVAATGSLELLDYGSGKGMQYRPQRVRIEGEEGEWGSVAEYWDVDNVECYDPCYVPFSRLPSGTFDGVISTDMIEHCAQEDVLWVLEEIFSYARKFVFLTIAGYAASKRLPNGENAHTTRRSLQWWQTVVGTVAARHPGILWRVRYYPLGGKQGYSEFGSAQDRPPTGGS